MTISQVRDRIRALSNPEGINQYTKGGGHPGVGTTHAGVVLKRFIVRSPAGDIMHTSNTRPGAERAKGTLDKRGVTHAIIDGNGASKMSELAKKASANAEKHPTGANHANAAAAHNTAMVAHLDAKNFSFARQHSTLRDHHEMQLSKIKGYGIAYDKQSDGSFQLKPSVK
jgi:hypothetical protein